MNGELGMYDSDRDAWLAYVSVHMAAQIPHKTDADLADIWERMTRSYQTAVWSHLNETQRARVRALRGEK